MKTIHIPQTVCTVYGLHKQQSSKVELWISSTQTPIMIHVRL